MFISLEGADGSGKTTLCKILAQRLGAVFYSTPPEKFLALREHIDKNATPKDQYSFYREGIHYASREIKEILATGSKIVVDRYWLTTYTYHQVKGVQVSLGDFNSIIMPTITIILSLGKNLQIERMISRGLSIEDKRMIDKQQEIAMAYYRNVLELNIPFIIIDTQRFSPEACAEIVIKSLVF